MHHTQANAAYGHQIQNHQQTSNPHHQQQSYPQPQQHSATAFGQITSQAHYEHHHQQQQQAAAAQAHAAQIAAQAHQQQRQHQEQYSYGAAEYQQPTTEHQSRPGQQGQSREGGQNIRWQQQNNGSGPTGTTAERRLPFVHRFHRNQQQNQGNQGNVLIQPYPHGQQGGGGSAAGGPQGHQGQGHHHHHTQGGQASHHHHPHHHRTPQTYHQQVLKEQEKRARNMAQYETNPIGALQERFQSRGIIPDYKFLQTEGQSHCPSFTFQVTVGDITSSGNGNTKKQAKQAAAKSMLDILDGRAPSGADGAKPTTAEGGEAKDGEKATAENGKKPAAPQVGNKIGMLQEFCVTKGLPMPVYDVQNVGGQPHQRVFSIGVKVGSLAMVGEGTSKKDSKREAAEKMYEKLKELGQGALPMINGGGKLEPGSHPDNSGGDFNKIDTLTGKHRDQIGKFFGDLGVAGNSVMTRLHKGPVVSVAGPNFVKFLKDLAEEQKFAVTYVEMDEPVEGGGVMSLVQISSMPVAVCTGMGPNLDAANNEASKSALLYLKMMTKKKALTEKEQANSAPPAGGNENKSNGRKKK